MILRKFAAVAALLVLAACGSEQEPAAPVQAEDVDPGAALLVHQVGHRLHDLVGALSIEACGRLIR